MSTATAADKSGKKPHYKDYVSFLENYKNGKKEDQNSVITVDSGVSFSLTSSSNNSSSSVYSDLADPPKNSFKEYLENYNNRKYGPVQLPVGLKKQNDKQQSAETKTMKSEVFIEINNPPSTVSKVVDIRNAQNVSTVSKVSKMFEKNDTENGSVVNKSLPPSGKVNTFNFEQKEERRRTSVNKIPLKKSHSISEKSKVFEDFKNSTNESFKTRTNGCVSPKPTLANSKPVFSSKIVVTNQNEDDTVPKTNGNVSPKPSLGIKPIIVPKLITETLIFPQKEEMLVPVPPAKSEGTNSTESINNIQTAPSTVTCLPPPPPPPLPVSQPPQNGPSNVPPPPPPPPANFAVKKVQNSPSKITVTTQKVVTNGAPRPNDAVDGTTRPGIDKNDPRVKRLVYGALREMYGAYHDKANDYIATLPRNRVRKNNGLDSIINSIASQGGLEKLNGRVNPSVDPE